MPILCGLFFRFPDRTDYGARASVETLPSLGPVRPPRFPQVETRPCQRDTGRRLAALSILSTCRPLRTPPSLPQEPTPNLELSPLTRPPSPSTACAGTGLRRETEPRCNRRGSCHHNLNNPSLFVPLNNPSLPLSSCDTLKYFSLSPSDIHPPKNSCCKSTSTNTSLVTGQRL